MFKDKNFGLPKSLIDDVSNILKENRTASMRTPSAIGDKAAADIPAREKEHEEEMGKKVSRFAKPELTSKLQGRLEKEKNPLALRGVTEALTDEKFINYLNENYHMEKLTLEEIQYIYEVIGSVMRSPVQTNVNDREIRRRGIVKVEPIKIPSDKTSKTKSSGKTPGVGGFAQPRINTPSVGGSATISDIGDELDRLRKISTTTPGGSGIPQPINRTRSVGGPAGAQTVGNNATANWEDQPDPLYKKNTGSKVKGVGRFAKLNPNSAPGSSAGAPVSPEGLTPPGSSTGGGQPTSPGSSTGGGQPTSPGSSTGGGQPTSPGSSTGGSKRPNPNPNPPSARTVPRAPEAPAPVSKPEPQDDWKSKVHAGGTGTVEGDTGSERPSPVSRRPSRPSRPSGGNGGDWKKSVFEPDGA